VTAPANSTGVAIGTGFTRSAAVTPQTTIATCNDTFGLAGLRGEWPCRVSSAVRMVTLSALNWSCRPPDSSIRKMAHLRYRKIEVGCQSRSL